MDDLADPKNHFIKSRGWVSIIFMILIVVGFGIRLYDLTDLPLDFHPTRQLLSAHKARGMYYQALSESEEWKRRFAIQQWKVRAAVEPEVVERLVAITYRYTGEKLWVARIYSSAFWILGGVFLYFLARNMVSGEAALAAVAFYLFLPYGLVASRSFQPDPLMVMLIIGFWWAVWQLAETLAIKENPPTSVKDGKKSTWLWAVLAGLMGGLAIYIKFVAAFFVISGGLGALLGRAPIRNLVRRVELWVMIGLGILPGTIYLIQGVWVQGYLTQQFGGRFFPALLLEPSYYLGWAGMLILVVGALFLILGVLGIFFFQTDRQQRFAMSLWSGYILFGLYFNYHISTHDYYSLPLIPIVALCITPIAGSLLGNLSMIASFPWKRASLYGLLILGLFLSLWDLRAQLKNVDYRPQAEYWAQIGDLLGRDAQVVALTQDYGMRLAYWGWLAPVTWPYSGDLSYHSSRGEDTEFEALFLKLTQGQEYFLVTDFEEIERQPWLQEKLKTGYSLSYQGDEFVVYDLMKARIH